ncbi:MAG: hypothetical protein PHF29_02320 [Candidatus Riflebacteria bacterium]|nr:hypothetical protein [Candidatus Riflebacteria bacterium]
MRLFTTKLKVFCATFILGILLAWMIAFPLHFALEKPSSHEQLNDKKTNCHSCCIYRFDKHDSDRYTIDNHEYETDFCSLCDLASQFYTNGLARIIDVSFSANVSILNNFLTGTYSQGIILTIFPRGPPDLIC